MIRHRIRPVVPFNPADPLHRKYYCEFVKRNGWQNSPIMFYVEPEYGNVLDMIRDKLSNYYLEKEFRVRFPRRYMGEEIGKNTQKTPKKTPKINDLAVAKKPQKTVKKMVDQ